MKILWLSYYYLPHVGGGTWSTYHLSLRLSMRGHRVQLIVPCVQQRLSIPWESALSFYRKNPSKVHIVPAFPIPRKLGPFLSIVFIFLAGLRLGKGVDVIVSQYHPHHLLCPIAVLLGRIFKIPTVLRADDVYREIGAHWKVVKIVNTLNEYFIKYARVFLIVCSENMEILMSRLRDRATNCYIGLNYNGVDLSEFRDVPSKENARKSVGIRHNRRVLLFMGRYSGAEYGIEVLLRALPIILEKVPDSILVFVGDELTSHQRALVNSLGIDRNVRTYGPKTRRQVINFIVATDVCIGPLMPTMAIPLKVLEYMACGKAVVTGIKSLSKDLAPNGSNFLIVPSEPKSVSEAVLMVLQDEDYARRLGSNAKTFVKKFSWDKVAYDLELILLECLG